MNHPQYTLTIACFGACLQQLHSGIVVQSAPNVLEQAPNLSSYTCELEYNILNAFAGARLPLIGARKCSKEISDSTFFLIHDARHGCGEQGETGENFERLA